MSAVEYVVRDGWVHVPDWLEMIGTREMARSVAVQCEQDGAEAERLLRKLTVLACEHGLGPVLSVEAQDALEFLGRDVT